MADEIREDSPAAIREFKGMGLHVVMLTGDNESTARAIGERAGVDDVIAGVLPDGKESVVKTLKEKGRVLMIGDGINDAPALTRADIGMAIGASHSVKKRKACFISELSWRQGYCLPARRALCSCHLYITL